MKRVPCPAARRSLFARVAGVRDGRVGAFDRGARLAGPGGAVPVRSGELGDAAVDQAARLVVRDLRVAERVRRLDAEVRALAERHNLAPALVQELSSLVTTATGHGRRLGK